MDRAPAIVRANIERYERMLETPLDPRARETVAKLLIEEKAKLPPVKKASDFGGLRYPLA
jgi:CBS domain containing-hemolysin-like protein